MSDLNQGIISSLFSIQNIFLLLFGIFIFNEKLSYMHLFGFFLMISCAILIGISDHGLERDKIKVFDLVIQRTPAYYSVLLAILSGALFGI